MNWPAYSEYKDSGIEWLGSVPSHWSKSQTSNGRYHWSPVDLEGGHSTTPMMAITSYGSGTYVAVPLISMTLRSNTCRFQLVQKVHGR